jgi:acetyl esterase/lipase
MCPRLLRVVVVLPFLLTPALAFAEDQPGEIPLWPNGAPGFEKRKDEKEVKTVQGSEYKITNVHNPTLTIFLPPKEKANGAAVVIAPGGGFRELWMMHEGINEAKWLNDRGIAAFVLKYRLPREKGSPYKLPEQPLQDGQRALRLVRSHAEDWHIDPSRVGIMGFSAGGELAAIVCNDPGKGKDDAADPIDRLSARPDFQVLIYSGPLGVRNQTVTKEMPPTFMVVGDKDGAAQWLTEHYLALKKAGVPAELHVYVNTPHGFGLRDSNKGRPSNAWIQHLEDFLGVVGILKKP